MRKDPGSRESSLNTDEDNHKKKNLKKKEQDK